MKNGQTVAAFEREFAAYVGAKYAIALCNGTATLHTALVAWSQHLGPQFPVGSRVHVSPLTMSAPTIAILQAGMVPVFEDVDPQTWLMRAPAGGRHITVSLYGLNTPWRGIVDAAQTLARHSPLSAFTSYSFQASKILSTGEGGMLVTNVEELATRAREFSSLGYRMRADQPRIDPAALKSPTFDRHYSLGFNYRMNDVTALAGLRQLAHTEMTAALVTVALDRRRAAAEMYAEAIGGCDWLTPQHVPEGWTHDYWTFAVACDTPERAARLADAVVACGGERPYPAWRLTYQEPAFRYLVRSAHVGDQEGQRQQEHAPIPTCICPVAESLQPRLLQFQTNDLASAERNATALRRAIGELS